MKSGSSKFEENGKPAREGGSWLKSRLAGGMPSSFESTARVPKHRHSFWYYWGGLTLFFLAIQIVTGVLLLLYYSPTPETAHESIVFLITQVRFGWLVRSLHAWSAQLVVACTLVHFFSTMLMKAYRKPRELSWFTGVALLALVLGFGFTGYLLPWDQLAYAGVNIGTEIPKSIPVVGNLLVQLLRGGDSIGAETLKRLFALHVSILPIATIVLVGLHLMLRFNYGLSTPIGNNTDGLSPVYHRGRIYKNMIAWTMGLMVLLALVLIFPVELGPKADMLGAAPPGIKPEWYFLPLYQTMKIVPADIMGISGEAIVNVLLGLIGAVVLMLPFLDKRAAREESGGLVTIAGWAAIMYMAVMITLAYTT